MKRWEAWWNHAALAAVGLTGLVYGAFRYFVANPDPDSRVGHPWQPGLMKAHLLVAPFAVFGVALLLRRHALSKLRHGEEKGRKTGLVMLALFAPLVLTGYLVQALTEPGTVKATGWIHAGLGLLVVLGYAFHPKRESALENGAGDGGNQGGPHAADLAHRHHSRFRRSGRIRDRGAKKRNHRLLELLHGHWSSGP